MQINKPNVIFFYDIGNINDNFDNVLKNIRNNITLIKAQLIENYKFKNEEYSWAGLICCRYNGHYATFIINLENEFKNLNKGSSYFYDDCSKLHDLEEIDSFKNLLSDYLAYIDIYVKK